MSQEETDFNWHMRQALLQQGYFAMHIREANYPGPADLIVYHNQNEAQVIDAWVELKVGSDWSGIRPSQREFMRMHWALGKNAIYALLDKEAIPYGAIRCLQGDEKRSELAVNVDPYKVKWEEVFRKFRQRK